MMMMMMMTGKVVVVGKRVLRRERDWPTASFVLDPHNSTENINFQSLISITENGGGGLECRKRSSVIDVVSYFDPVYLFLCSSRFL